MTCGALAVARIPAKPTASVVSDLALCFFTASARTADPLMQIFDFASGSSSLLRA
jgi:hypothetical protein